MNPVYPIPFNGTGHPSYNGYRWYGEQVAKGLWYAMENKRYETVKPISIEVLNNTKIKVNLYAPVYPITIDTYTQSAITNYGFEVKLDGKLVNIKSVNTDGKSIIVELYDNTYGKIVEISYAGLGAKGQGNICDSDRWTSMTIYEDDNEDSPNNIDGGIAISKRPTDVNGKNIFNHKYPMQNWLTNFYYNLSFGFYKHFIKCAVGDELTNKINNLLSLEISYTSSDNRIATVVASTGVVTANTTGTCVITAKISKSEDSGWSDSYILLVV